VELFVPVGIGIATYAACGLVQKLQHARRQAVFSGALNNSMDWEEFRMSLEAKLAKEARIQWLRAFAEKYLSEERMEEAYSCLEEADGLARNEIASPVRLDEIAC
jgi:hypothetical protein